MTSPHRTGDVVVETPRTTTDPRRDARPFWGRSARLGGGPGPLIAVSLLLGTLLAALIGVIAYGLAATAGHEDPRAPLLLGVIMTTTSLLPGGALVWVLLVDRDTVRGAIRNTEDTVEGRWYGKATSGAFHDLLVLLGLGAFVVGLAGWQVDTGLLAAGLVLFMALSVGVRYLLLKRRG